MYIHVQSAWIYILRDSPTVKPKGNATETIETDISL